MKNKEQTKRKLIDAIGEIIRTEGPEGLGVNNIARKAAVDKKLIYRYFRSFNNLIETYIIEKDFWMNLPENQEVMAGLELPGAGFVTDILQEQFRYFYGQPEMQRLILWEISDDSDMMRSIHNARESMGQKMFGLTDPHFKGSEVNFRAISALLVGGIYYAILHTRFNGGMICDVNIHTPEGREALKKAIEQIVGWAYKAGEEKEIKT